MNNEKRQSGIEVPELSEIDSLVEEEKKTVTVAGLPTNSTSKSNVR